MSLSLISCRNMSNALSRSSKTKHISFVSFFIHSMVDDVLGSTYYYLGMGKFLREFNLVVSWLLFSATFDFLTYVAKMVFNHMKHTNPKWLAMWLTNS